MTLLRPTLALLSLAILSACGASETTAIDAGSVGMDAHRVDATALDANDAVDASIAVDASVADDAHTVPAGQALYETHCALCHGVEGEGYLADNAPAIGFASYLSVASDAFLYDAIYDGRPGTPMSAWGDAHGGPLSSAATSMIVEYLRSLSTLPAVDVSGDVVVGDAARGAPVYAENCARCHGENGDGESAVSLNHPNFSATASDGFIRYAIQHGRPGTDMDAWGGTLSSTTIDDLVVLIRTLMRDDSMMSEWPIEAAPALDALVIHPEGASADFLLREGRFVASVDVKAAMDAERRMVLLDARSASDWVLGHIAGAAPFPFYDVDELATYLPNDGTWIIAYCACPHAASGAVVDQLRTRGFANTAVLDEGINFWRDEGFPMARGMIP